MHIYIYIYIIYIYSNMFGKKTITNKKGKKKEYEYK